MALVARERRGEVIGSLALGADPVVATGAGARRDRGVVEDGASERPHLMAGVAALAGLDMVERLGDGAALVAVCSLLIACSTVDEPKPVPAAPPLNIEQPGRHLITVSERETGANIVLDAAQELAVRLPLNEVDV